MKPLHLLFLTFILAGTVACSDIPSSQKQSAKIPEGHGQLVDQKAEHPRFFTSTKSLDKYWFQGKGEINVYELQQNRYKDIHPGKAVLVFVTEDFLTDKQVKNDRYENPNSTLILKTNFLQRFTTGIYDYSLMTSVFTPAQVEKHPHSLKVTNSVQDWCGQVFSQINLEDGSYTQQLHSYFEEEGEQTNQAEVAILEDEFFNRIRMDWQALPVGEFPVIPSSTSLRLRHRPFGVYEATLSLEDYEGDDFAGDDLKSYTILYPDENRTLQIVFHTETPNIIEGWTDEYPSVFDQKPRKTIATRQHTALEAYWSLNSLEDQTKRADIGLNQ